MKSRGDALRVAILGLLAACWYGPPERYRAFDEYMTADDRSVTVYLRGFTAVRLPRGVAAFPDGGMPKKASSGAEVFFCRAGQNEFRQVARVYVPPQLEGKTQYHLRAWARDVAILGLGADTGAVIGIRSDGHLDSTRSPSYAETRATGLRGVALPECQHALDSLKHADPVLNYTK